MIECRFFQPIGVEASGSELTGVDRSSAKPAFSAVGRMLGLVERPITVVLAASYLATTKPLKSCEVRLATKRPFAVIAVLKPNCDSFARKAIFAKPVQHPRNRTSN